VQYVLITPPTADVLSLADAKTHLRAEDFNDDDVLIGSYIRAAQGEIDPAYGGWLGRALRPQTWELRLDEFPCDLIKLRFPPLISIASITYVDPDGDDQTLAANTEYRIINSGSSGPALIVPAYGESWPSVRSDHESVRVRFTSGYPVADPEGDPPVVDRLPDQIVQWMKLRVGDFYEKREAVNVGDTPSVLPHIENLLFNLRIF
jgi:uncharacterized phiE125 gp8 family phage protein